MLIRYLLNSREPRIPKKPLNTRNVCLAALAADMKLMLLHIPLSCLGR